MKLGITESDTFVELFKRTKFYKGNKIGITLIPTRINGIKTSTVIEISSNKDGTQNWKPLYLTINDKMLKSMKLTCPSGDRPT